MARAAYAAFLIGISVTVIAAPVRAHASPVTATTLSGLDEQEKGQLLAKLLNAQNEARSRKEVYFLLTSGSAMLFDKVDVTPRAAFTALDLSQPWRIEKLPKPTGVNSARYRLDYFPSGLGKLYWTMTVDLDFNGDIAVVNMVYQAPAPF